MSQSWGILRPFSIHPFSSWTRKRRQLMLALFILTVLLYSSLAFGQQASAYSADSHTAALWRFDEFMGQTAFDTNRANNGAATATTIAPGRFGNARQFRGSGAGDFITVPNSASLNGLSQISVEVWIFPTSFDLRAFNGDEAIVQKGDETPPYNIFSLRMTRNGGACCGASSFSSFTASFQVIAGPAGATASSTIQHPPGQWYFIAGTYDGTTARLFVNGLLESERSGVPRAIVGNGSPLFINNHTWAGGTMRSGGRIGGLIDEVRISNVARTPAEITTATLRGFLRSPVDAFRRSGFAFGVPWLCGMPAHLHTGVDVQARVGDPVRASADGVAHIADLGFWKGAVIVQHALMGGICTLYEHVEPRVREGDLVRQGQIIAVVASLPAPYGAHLHSGIRLRPFAANARAASAYGALPPPGCFNCRACSQTGTGFLPDFPDDWFDPQGVFQ